MKTHTYTHMYTQINFSFYKPLIGLTEYHENGRTATWDLENKEKSQILTVTFDYCYNFYLFYGFNIGDTHFVDFVRFPAV